MPTDATHPVVFLSYSHDSDDHRTRVRQLATMRNLAKALEASGHDQAAAALRAEVEAFERETGEGSETADEPVV